MKQDPTVEIKIQNYKDAYVTLFNALGPKHYSTLFAAFELGVAFRNLHNIEESHKYLKIAYYGLLEHEGEFVGAQPWDPGVFYSDTIRDNIEEAFEVAYPLIQKYPEMIKENIDSYLNLQDISYHYYLEKGNQEELGMLVRTTFSEIHNYLDRDNLKYIVYLYRLCLVLKDEGKSALAKNWIKCEKKLNTDLDGNPISEIFDISIKIISLSVFTKEGVDISKRVIKIAKELPDVFKRNYLSLYDAFDYIRAFPILLEYRELMTKFFHKLLFN